MPLKPEAPKVKVQLKTDASVTREFTKQGWEMIQGPNLKWVLSEDQSQPEAKKKVVAPVEEVRDRKPELRAKYKELTGTEADAVWNEARLFVEISKAEKVAQSAPAQTEVPVETTAGKPTPGKRGPKAKVKA